MAGRLGYCGLDRRRAALSGDEMRGCWETMPDESRPPDSAPWASRIIDPAGARRSRVDFVPVDDLRVAGGAPLLPGTRAAAEDPRAFRFLLWEDLEA